MTAHYKVAGVWKELTGVHTKVAGVWKEIEGGWIKVSGVWKQFYSWLAFALTTTSATQIVISPTSAYAEIVVKRDGSVWYTDPSLGSTEKVGEWVSNGASATVGDGYEVRFGTITGTTPDGAAIDLWLAITVDRTWSLSQSGVGIKTCSGTLEIRNATTLVVECSAAGSITADVEVA